MRRFLVFPPLFAVWFLAAQFGLLTLFKLSFWLTLRIIASSGSGLRVRFNLFPLSDWWSPLFLRGCIVGAVAGTVFALLDLNFHPENTKTEETLFRLLSHLLKSGAVAIALVLLYFGAFEIPVALHLARTPFPRYTPYRALHHWGNYLPHILLLGALLWSTARTLRRGTE